MIQRVRGKSRIGALGKHLFKCDRCVVKYFERCERLTALKNPLEMVRTLREPLDQLVEDLQRRLRPVLSCS